MCLIMTTIHASKKNITEVSFSKTNQWLTVIVGEGQVSALSVQDQRSRSEVSVLAMMGEMPTMVHHCASVSVLLLMIFQ